MDLSNDLYTLLSLFFRAFRVPLSVYENDRPIRNFTSLIFEPDPAQHYMENVKMDSDTITFRTEHETMYGMILIKESGKKLLVGPVPRIKYAAEQGDAILKDLDQPLSRRSELRYLLTRTQAMPQGHFVSVLNLLYYTVNGCIPSGRQAVDSHDIRDAVTEMLPARNYNADIVHNSQDIERQVLDAIEYGRAEEIDSLYFQMITSDISEGRTASSEVRHYKNIVIGSAALASRAAIRGGLSYDQALTMSDRFISEAEANQDEKVLLLLLRETFLSFAQAVRQLKRPAGCSALTKSILEDVDRHLNKPLSVKAIAGHLNRSVSGVSHTFRKEMGCSLQDYIHIRKIEKAKHMLQFGRLSILEIATELGFSSQPHFQTVFKRYAGMTPGEYRSQSEKPPTLN